MILLWMSAALALSAQADQPDYCDHPYESVCNAPIKNGLVPTRADLQKKITSELDADLKQSNILGRIEANTSSALEARSAARKKKDLAGENKSVKDLHESMKLYSLVLNRAQDLVMAEFKKLGITEEDFNRRIAAAQKNLADGVADLKSFQGNNSGIEASTIGNTLQSVEIVTVRKFKDPKEEGNSYSFYTACGVDGLEANAYYQDIDNKFRICPGYLLGLLRTGSLDGLTFVVSHELGHSIGVERSVLNAPDDPAKKSVMLARYQPFIKCVDENYSREFSSISDVGNYALQKGGPALKARLKELQNANPVDLNEVLQAKRAVESLDLERGETFEDLYDASNTAQRLFSSKPSPVQEHAQELCADAIGYVGLERQLAPMHPPADPWQTFMDQFHPLCERDKSPYRKLKYGPTGDDGLHPTTKYRIEAALRYPGIRKALGCRSLEPVGGRPFCSLDGAEKPSPFSRSAVGVPAETNGKPSSMAK